MVWMGVCWASCLLGNPHVVFSSGVRLVEELVVSSVAVFRVQV